MKKTIMILAAIALVLGLPQCKKQTTGILEGNVEIILDVSADKGSRIHVDPDSGDVAFEQNDVVYVGSGGTFVGTLTCRGTRFTGKITDATLGQPLYFFFLGNKTPEETLTPGTSTSCSVNIGDQTSGKLPVISFAISNENFTGQGTYTAFFLNKAALVKFNISGSTVPACIMGMNNKVTVDFATNGFTYSQEDDGCIQLPAGSGERWAILLPQASGTHTVTAGLGGVVSTEIDVPAIAANAYLYSGIDVLIGAVDLALPSGNLWAVCNLGATAPEGYGDYFAWGETQPSAVFNWTSYKYSVDGDHTLTKYCNNTSYGYNGFCDNITGLLPEDDPATVLLGEGWHTPTLEDYNELKNSAYTNWQWPTGGGWSFTSKTNGKTVFLPYAGYRDGTNLCNPGEVLRYWLRTLNTGSPNEAWCLYKPTSGTYGTNKMDRFRGFSIRAVRYPD